MAGQLSVMASKMFLVFLALTMVIDFSGNCNAQNFKCVLVPCGPGKVRKHVCLSWSQTSGGAEYRETVIVFPAFFNGVVAFIYPKVSW